MSGGYIDSAIETLEDMGYYDVGEDCESSARPEGYVVPADLHWYWVEYEGLNETYTAPAMYRANADCFYSYEFSGIPRRQIKVLREA